MIKKPRAWMTTYEILTKSSSYVSLFFMSQFVIFLLTLISIEQVLQIRGISFELRVAIDGLLSSFLYSAFMVVSMFYILPSFVKNIRSKSYDSLKLHSLALSLLTLAGMRFFGIISLYSSMSIVGGVIIASSILQLLQRPILEFLFQRAFLKAQKVGDVDAIKMYELNGPTLGYYMYTFRNSPRLFFVKSKYQYIESGERDIDIKSESKTCDFVAGQNRIQNDVDHDEKLHVSLNNSKTNATINTEPVTIDSGESELKHRAIKGRRYYYRTNVVSKLVRNKELRYNRPSTKRSYANKAHRKLSV